MPKHIDMDPTPEQRRAIEAHLGRMPSRRDNDGMVPTLSQVWGDVIYAVQADHMDVMGHFHGPLDHPRHVDWLRTGSNFAMPEFEGLFGAVASFMEA
jgi:hypothetical protein